MERMVRKQVYITVEQNRKLKAKAKRLGITESEVVRRALDKYFAEENDAGMTDSKMTREQALTFLKAQSTRMAELAKTTPQKERDWTRDELYEERLSKLGSVIDPTPLPK
ncbi:MAG: ribbon-helix-helix domain-containing protein [Dehalococcoidia bacterium]